MQDFVTMLIENGYYADKIGLDFYIKKTSDISLSSLISALQSDMIDI